VKRNVNSKLVSCFVSTFEFHAKQPPKSRCFVSSRFSCFNSGPSYYHFGFVVYVKSITPVHGILYSDFCGKREYCYTVACSIWKCHSYKFVPAALGVKEVNSPTYTRIQQ